MSHSVFPCRQRWKFHVTCAPLTRVLIVTSEQLGITNVCDVGRALTLPERFNGILCSADGRLARFSHITALVVSVPEACYRRKPVVALSPFNYCSEQQGTLTPNHRNFVLFC